MTNLFAIVLEMLWRDEESGVGNRVTKIKNSGFSLLSGTGEECTRRSEACLFFHFLSVRQRSCLGSRGHGWLNDSLIIADIFLSWHNVNTHLKAPDHN